MPMPNPTSLLMAFCAGIGATLAWQSYGDAASGMIASWYPQLGWLATRPGPTAQNAPGMIVLAAQASSDQQRLNAMSLDLNAVRQNVDRIATTQEEITRSVDQVTAGQERMTREITKLQFKNSEAPPRPTPASARKSALRLSRPSAVH
jgi:septal ring factor EnvC (AmiA/AmiB activator)